MAELTGAEPDRIAAAEAAELAEAQAKIEELKLSDRRLNGCMRTGCLWFFGIGIAGFVLELMGVIQ